MHACMGRPALTRTAAQDSRGNWQSLRMPACKFCACPHAKSLWQVAPMCTKCPTSSHLRISKTNSWLASLRPVHYVHAAHAGHRVVPVDRRAQLHLCNSSRHGRLPVGCQPLQRTGEHYAGSTCTAWHIDNVRALGRPSTNSVGHMWIKATDLLLLTAPGMDVFLWRVMRLRLY